MLERPDFIPERTSSSGVRNHIISDLKRMRAIEQAISARMPDGVSNHRIQALDAMVSEAYQYCWDLRQIEEEQHIKYLETQS